MSDQQSAQESELSRLLDRWLELVEKVEEGYDCTGPEMNHDVLFRTDLAALWLDVPVAVRQARQATLDQADARFLAATIPWPGHEDEAKWWEWRIPRLLVDFGPSARESGWPHSWGMMPFPKPDAVSVELY